MIYFDNGMTTEPSFKVLETMDRFQREKWRDRLAPYQQEDEYFQMIDESIDTIYHALGVHPSHIFQFTSSLEEASKDIFEHIYFETVYKEGKNFFLMPRTESAHFMKCAEKYKKIGCETKLLDADSTGLITEEILEKAYFPKASALLLSWANPLTGVIQPLWEIGEFCKRKNMTFVVDASDVIGKSSFRFEEIPVDILIFSSDKFHGIKGAGGILWKEKKEMKKKNDPSHSADISMGALVSLGVAVGDAIDFLDTMCTEVAYLRAYFEEKLLEKVPDAVFFGKHLDRLPHVSSFAIPAIHGELLSYTLSERGLFVGLGGGRYQKLELLLRHMNVPPLLAKSAVTVSLSRETKESDVLKAVEIIAREAYLLRKISSAIWKGEK